MTNPTHSHSFWRDRNPVGCLTCGKTESELLKSFIRTQKEFSYAEGYELGYEAGDAAGRENVGKWFMNSEIPAEIIKAKQEERMKKMNSQIKKISADIQDIIIKSKATFFVKDKNAKIPPSEALRELKETISNNVGLYFYNLLKK